MRKLPVLLPSMKCDTGCGECCGVVPATAQEFSRINVYLKQKGIVPQDQGVTCPFYQQGACQVYPVRPLVCQLFGHLKDAKMTCPRGYNTNIPTEKGNRMLALGGKPTRLLHEFLPDFSMDKLLAEVQKIIS